MNIAIIRKSAIAAIAVAVVATGTLAGATSQAEAGNKFWKGAAIGFGAAFIANSIHNHNRHHSSHHSTHYTDDCWYETEKRWDDYGDHYFVKVKYCS